MSLRNKAQSKDSLFSSLRNLIIKFKQSPDIYPIKYYKKSCRYRRHYQVPLVK